MLQPKHLLPKLHQILPPAAPAQSSTSTIKKRPSIQKEGSSQAFGSSSSAKIVQMQKAAEDKTKEMMAAANIKPLPASPKVVLPKPTASQKSPSSSAQDSDVEIISPPPPVVLNPIVGPDRAT
ncbi:hypothetical protein U1Q18_034469 [Sarracenia purpurea var. burkii]